MEALFISADSVGPETNTSRYRIFAPAKYLQRAGHQIALQANIGAASVFNDAVIPVDRGIDYGAVGDVVLIERNVQPEWIEKLRLFGAKRIIITFDDHYGQLPNYAVAKKWWTKHYGKFVKSLGMADLVIVPSLRLKEEFAKHCKQIEYVANYIDDDAWLDLPPKPEIKSIGWGGSAEHLGSWDQKYIYDALARILTENPDWQLRMSGEVVPAIINHFPIGTQISYSKWMSYDSWIKIMSTFSVGIAPLSGEYDRYRSNLKLVEYGLGRVPWIATKLDPYVDVEVRGGVLIKNTDWYDALNTMIHSPTALEGEAVRGREWAETYLMSRNVSVYEELLWGKHA